MELRRYRRAAHGDADPVRARGGASTGGSEHGLQRAPVRVLRAGPDHCRTGADDHGRPARRHPRDGQADVQSDARFVGIEHQYRRVSERQHPLVAPSRL